MTTEKALTESESLRIRLDEKLRHDVRIEQRDLLWWINTPIVIWVLSAIVLGFVPFVYSEIQKDLQIAQEERQIRRDALESLRSEIEFRIAQFDEVLNHARRARQNAAVIADEDLLDVIANDRLSKRGAALRALFSSAPPLRVASELGGLYAIPRMDESASVWIGGTGWQNSYLPRGRGFKERTYENDSLFSLWKKYTTIERDNELSKDEVAKVQSAFDALERATLPNETVESLPGISSNALTMRKWSERANIAMASELREDTVAWIEGVENAWHEVIEFYYGVE